MGGSKDEVFHGRGWLAWVMLVIAIAVCWFALEAQKPPAAKSANASLRSSRRVCAMEHVVAIARSPHPTGSPEAERVREIVVEKLAELGLAAEIQIPKRQTVAIAKYRRTTEGTRSAEQEVAALMCPL